MELFGKSKLGNEENFLRCTWRGEWSFFWKGEMGSFKLKRIPWLLFFFTPPYGVLGKGSAWRFLEESLDSLCMRSLLRGVLGKGCDCH